MEEDNYAAAKKLDWEKVSFGKVLLVERRHKKY